VPALILVDHRTASLRVAGLTVLDRLLVAVSRAGFGRITLVAHEPPSGLKRATALGIPFQIVREPPPRERETFVASSNVLVQAGDVRTLLQQGGRLASGNGALLPLGVLPSGNVAWDIALNQLPVHEARGIACCVSDRTTAHQAASALWASLHSSSDGLVDRFFNRPCGRILSKLLVYTPIHPNAVSLASVAIGLVAAWFFTAGNYQSAVFAAILFQLSAIVDCVDGDIARIAFKESAFGRWLDLAGDQVVHVAVFAAIAVGLVHSGQAPFASWLGLSAVLGAVLSFVVIVRGMRRPLKDPNRLLQRLIDSATNRDFSVLVLMLACCNRLEWFLWLSAIGSHLFWLAALVLQLNSDPETRLAQ
jgi:phosphatidylglycerophosphate synthase